MGSLFTHIIRPLDRGKLGGKHISFLNGVISLLWPKSFSHICYIPEPFTLYHRVSEKTVQPQGPQVKTSQNYTVWTSGITTACSNPFRLLFPSWNLKFWQIIDGMGWVFDGLCCWLFNALCKKGRDFSERDVSVARWAQECSWQHSHLGAFRGRLDEVSELRCLCTQCLCKDIQGYC